MNSESYAFQNPSMFRSPRATRNVLIYTGKGRKWHACSNALARGVKLPYAKMLTWSALRDMLDQSGYIKSFYLDNSTVLIDEYPINDESANDLISSLAQKGFSFVICSGELPSVSKLPEAFQIVRCQYSRRKEVGHV